MADETPPDSTSPRRPVRMGLRVVARHSAGRYGGRALARDVVESHRPKHLDAATRLSRSAAAASAATAAPTAAGAAVRRGPGATAGGARGRCTRRGRWLRSARSGHRRT